MLAAVVAQVLGGRPDGTGGFLCRCPLPDHGRRRGDLHPSLSVRDGNRAPLVVCCHGGCNPLDILAELRRRGLQGNPESWPPSRPMGFQIGPPIMEPDPKSLRLWQAAKPAGDAVAAYLRRRGITIDPPTCLRQGELSTRHGTLPTMVAAVETPGRGVTGAHRTVITRDGRKAPIDKPKLNQGRLLSGAVRLAPAGAVLGLAEGVETALSAMQLSGVPTWAALGLRLRSVWIPDFVKELHVFADHDPPGQQAARAASAHWQCKGLRVFIQTPPTEGSDWNDWLQARTK